MEKDGGLEEVGVWWMGFERVGFGEISRFVNVDHKLVLT